MRRGMREGEREREAEKGWIERDREREEVERGRHNEHLQWLGGFSREPTHKRPCFLKHKTCTLSVFWLFSPLCLVALPPVSLCKPATRESFMFGSIQLMSCKSQHGKHPKQASDGGWGGEPPNPN